MAQARKAQAEATKPKKPPHANAYKWTPEIEGEIFDRIAKGQAIRKICDDDWLPSWKTFRKRLIEDAEFGTRYARAREAQAETLAGEILEIADDARNDWMERNDENGAGWVANGEHIQRSKLRIEARKWLAGKLAPKVYGDKLDVDHGGNLTITLPEVAKKL